MTPNTYKKNNQSFDTAVGFLECRAHEAGLTDFTLNQAFMYNETQQTDTDGYITETVLFDHLASGRTIGIEVDKDMVSSVWVADHGNWIDEGTDADDIRRNPRAWFARTLLPKKYAVTVDISFSMDVSVDAYDEDTAKELARGEAERTYLIAKVDGVDSTVSGIEEV